MVLVMANGCAGNERLHEEHEDWPVFKKGLQLACTDLAKQIARDGEGATKLIEVEVNGAKSNLEAQIIAKKIVGSKPCKNRGLRNGCELGQNHCRDRRQHGCCDTGEGRNLPGQPMPF